MLESLKMRLLQLSSYRLTVLSALCILSFAIGFTGCGHDATAPPIVPRQLMITWEVDELSPLLTDRMWILDLCAIGNEVYVGGISRDQRSSLFRFKDGNWQVVVEAAKYGMGGVVIELESIDDNLLIAVGGEKADRICLYDFTEGWRDVPSIAVGAAIQTVALGRNREIFVGIERGILKYSGEEWREIYSFERLTDFDPESQRIEIESMCVDPISNSILLVAMRKWQSMPSREYLIEIRENEARIIDSIQYPRSEQNMYNFGSNLSIVESEVFSFGSALYRIAQGKVEIVSLEMRGVWLAGSYKDGNLFCASTNTVKCYLDGHWIDITPENISASSKLYPLQGMAVMDSTIFLGARLSEDTTLVLRGHISYR